MQSIQCSLLLLLPLLLPLLLLVLSCSHVRLCVCIHLRAHEQQMMISAFADLHREGRLDLQRVVIMLCVPSSQHSPSSMPY